MIRSVLLAEAALSAAEFCFRFVNFRLVAFVSRSCLFLRTALIVCFSPQPPRRWCFFAAGQQFPQFDSFLPPHPPARWLLRNRIPRRQGCLHLAVFRAASAGSLPFSPSEGISPRVSNSRTRTTCPSSAVASSLSAMTTTTRKRRPGCRPLTFRGTRLRSGGSKASIGTIRSGA
jgi:hypothetical protein